ncbi:hypothetical protein SAMN05421747_11854 [Parapedobacter composti]|uniref:Uncharacterized protein n=1 Tax=Parapedobacter composti TaxID=623281 RepID=A0A1I1L2S2_9SPHI|nr:DUF6266 family protein [Parapedobacter composti]SFC67346.1 hypothetical protein SAMN05421747_11854 [Parapedobacter composti]
MEFFYDVNKPKKKAQPYGKLAVQQRMRLAMAFLNPLRPVIAESWLRHGQGSKKKAFGQALKKLMEDALEGEYPDQHVIPERVTISMGMLPALQLSDVVHSREKLEVYFSGGNSRMALAHDEVVLVVYSPEAGVAGRNTDVCVRADGYIAVDLPPQLRTTPFHAYLFAHRANRKQYSKSVYVGGLSPL